MCRYSVEISIYIGGKTNHRDLDYSNWASGEPNNYNGAQHCVVMKVWGSVSDGENDFRWDDISCDKIKSGNFSGLDTTIGYICEAAGKTYSIFSLSCMFTHQARA